MKRVWMLELSRRAQNIASNKVEVKNRNECDEETLLRHHVNALLGGNIRHHTA